MLCTSHNDGVCCFSQGMENLVINFSIEDLVTLSLIALIFLTSIVILFFKKKRVAGIIAAIGFAIFLAIGTGEIPGFLLGKLQKEYLYESYPNWQDKNVIILLGMATERLKGSEFNTVVPGTFAYSRIVKTAQLYKSCVEFKPDCMVIVSGGDPQKLGQSEAEVYANVLIDMGVDPKHIIKEGNSRNTFENARFTSEILNGLGDRVKVLVTSGIHLERSALYFRHFGISHLHQIPADYFSAKYSLIPVAYNFAIADFALHEFIGMARYSLYNSMGWNPPKPGPGVAINISVNGNNA